MASPQETGEAQFTFGREGLKIPAVTSVRMGGFLVVQFFRDMWELNGLELPTDAHGNLEEKPFNHELVIPGGDRILVVLKGSYTPRKREDVEYDQRRHREQQEWGVRQHTTLGYERHGVYIPPVNLGKFIPHLKVEHSHESGGNSWRTDPIDVTYQGNRIREYDFYDENDQTTSIPDKHDDAREKYAAYLAGVLNATAEFLS